MRLEKVSRECFDEAVDVLCEAFSDYPVMHYVIGEVGEDYPRRLRLLVAFFTEARFQRGDLVVTVRHDEEMLAAANIDLPGTPLTSGEVDPLESYRNRLWSQLGPEARARYESYGQATAHFIFSEPRYHLGMIGVQRKAAGTGMGRKILDALHEVSASHPESLGISLTTEVAANVSLYEHFGYRQVGHETLPRLETWGFFRENSRSDRSAGSRQDRCRRG